MLVSINITGVDLTVVDKVVKQLDELGLDYEVTNKIGSDDEQLIDLNITLGVVNKGYLILDIIEKIEHELSSDVLDKYDRQYVKDMDKLSSNTATTINKLLERDS